MAYNPALPVGAFKTRPRLTRKGFANSGSGVRVTNPKASTFNTNRRTKSLGMGGLPTQSQKL